MFNQDMGHLMNPDPERPVFTETAGPRHRWQGRTPNSPPSVQGFSNTSPGRPDPTQIPSKQAWAKTMATPNQLLDVAS